MKNKYTKTELPITIITDDEHREGDNLELTRQRIEKATLYVHSLFNSIRYALETLPSFDDQKLEEIVWDAKAVCEIGYAVADSILASASCLTEFQPDEQTETKPNLDSLANHIAFLLNNPDLPEPIYEGLQQGITDAFNSLIDQSEITSENKTAEYIAKVLRGFKKTEAKNV